MKLYIDDIRPAPEGWQQARTVTDAIRFLAQFKDQIDEISIDHDISYTVEVAGTQRPFPSPENFTAVAYFIGEIWKNHLDTQPKITIHSANPVGTQSIARILSFDYDLGCETVPASRVNRLESEV